MNPEEYRVMRQVEDTLWWYRGMQAITRAVLERYYSRCTDLRLLDAGCGTGGAMGYLADYGAVVGLDHSPLALQLARERGDLRLARGSITALPFPAASFDVVLSLDVIIMLEDAGQDIEFIRDAARVLAPGGRLFLRTAAYDWLRGAHDRIWGVVHRYALGEVRAKLEQAGLVVEHLSHANMWLFPLALLKRMSEPLFPQQNGSDLTLNVGPFNGVLAAILGSEARLVAHRHLPFGLSIMAVARKRA